MSNVSTEAKSNNVTQVLLSIFVATVLLIIGFCGWLFLGPWIVDAFRNRTMVMDSRDNRNYEIVAIGAQTWMAENLDYSIDGSWCYGDSVENCKKRGRLYTWPMAQTVCPVGWHLPNESEWGELLKYTGVIQGDLNGNLEVLRSKEPWLEINENLEEQASIGKDVFGFKILPSGTRFLDGRFLNKESSTCFWTSTEGEMLHKNGVGGSALCFGTRMVGGVVIDKSSGYSVRCIKNDSSTLNDSNAQRSGADEMSAALNYTLVRTDCPSNNVDALFVVRQLQLGEDVDTLIGCRSNLYFSNTPSDSDEGLVTVFADRASGVPTLVVKLGKQNKQIAGRVFQGVPCIYVGLKEYNFSNGASFFAATYVLESEIKNPRPFNLHSVSKSAESITSSDDTISLHPSTSTTSSSSPKTMF